MGDVVAMSYLHELDVESSSDVSAKSPRSKGCDFEFSVANTIPLAGALNKVIQDSREHQWISNFRLVSDFIHLYNPSLLADRFAKALARLAEDLETACTTGDTNKVQAYFDAAEGRPQQEVVDALALMSARHNQLPVLQICLRHGATMTRPLATTALVRGSVAIYQALLAAGLDINADFHYAADALTVAVYKGDVELTSFVLSAGADVHSDRLWSHQYGPMAIAGLFAPVDILRVLISHGATIENSLAIHTASRAGRIDVIQYLLDEGADVNEIPPANHYLTFNTAYDLGPPIHYAADKQNLETVEFLLNHGADATLWDRAGRTIVERSRKGETDWEDLKMLLASRGLVL